ncbi:envelope-like protein [Cucumis melo var. makuwa]|uniref:Envelope-like protein n=1 Tax=Cucumis melo var. makuwa TaxID=1194695 RepID=A0A5D3E1E0_CUCMM|nr:envelope-like protein [Cucumis melo var. makuwa]TYK29275.1 envelope-like protein [Cucumis melo var. makuwa]
MSFKNDCSSSETQSTHFLEDSTIAIPLKSTMVNTRKGNYQARLSKVVDKAPASRTNMHVPNPDAVGESTKNLGGNFADLANQNAVDVDAHVEPTGIRAPNNVEPDGSHVLDIEHAMRPSRNLYMFDIEDVDESAEGFFVHRDLASRIINTLIVKSRALSTSINLLFDGHLEVDLLVRHLKTLVPSSSTGAQD